MSDATPPQRKAPEPAAPKGNVSVEDLQRILEQHAAWLAGLNLKDDERAELPPDAKRLEVSGAELRGANLRGANLRLAILTGDFADADLREANLVNANLKTARGLLTEQLAGANVTGATLPDEIARSVTETLGTIEEAAKNARRLLFGLLLACVYSWLTIATTTDARLLTNTASSPLPIVGTEIPIAGFYWAAPVILLGVYLYLHLMLQHLWKLLATLPAVFPDGVPLDEKAYPWLLTGLVRIHVPLLRKDRPDFARLRALLAVVLAWWIVPATVLLFWGRYLPRHDWPGTSLHIVLVVLAVTSALLLQCTARRTLRGEARDRLSLPTVWKEVRSYKRAAVVLATAAIMVGLSRGAIGGSPGDPVPRAFSVLGFDVFANLREAQVSERPANYTLIAEEERNGFVAGADLRLTDLRNADATGAFLENADLSFADLTNAILFDANLYAADLTDADLIGADLTGANLTAADLIGADLSGATLEDAVLRDADLTHANLEGAVLTNANLEDAFLGDADLTSATLEGAVFANANLGGAVLRDADLTGATLEGAVLRDADLTGATLTGASLTGANLESAVLRDADLTRAGLVGAFLRDADLAGAVLRDADLDGALLVGAVLRDADLDGALLVDANLIGANLTNATLRGANLTDAILPDADLGNADLTGAILVNTLPRGAISPQQLDRACGDDSTVLPAGLTIPAC